MIEELKERKFLDYLCELRSSPTNDLEPVSILRDIQWEGNCLIELDLDGVPLIIKDKGVKPEVFYRNVAETVLVYSKEKLKKELESLS